MSWIEEADEMSTPPEPVRKPMQVARSVMQDQLPAFIRSLNELDADLVSVVRENNRRGSLLRNDFVVTYMHSYPLEYELRT